MKHQHRTTKSVVRPYVGYSVRPDRPNPAAHGGVTIVERCACGAQRLTNVNGRHIETGRWQQ